MRGLAAAIAVQRTSLNLPRFREIMYLFQKSSPYTTGLPKPTQLLLRRLVLRTFILGLEGTLDVT
jgi:hypothetical protein